MSKNTKKIFQEIADTLEVEIYNIFKEDIIFQGELNEFYDYLENH